MIEMRFSTGFERLRRIPRVLFVGESICLAHVGRPALLARWAREAGYEVAFACGPKFAHVARGEGLEPIPLLTVDDEHLRRMARGQFFYSDETLEAYVAAERKLLREIRPDLVVGDWRLTLSVSARLEGVPMLSLVNAQWSPASACRMPPPRAGIWKRLPPGLRAACFRMVLPLGFRFFARALDGLRERHGLEPLRDLRRLYAAGGACAYLDIPELIPLEPMPRGHFYLGPLAWAPTGLPAPALEGVECPLAYVSMGSSGDTSLVPAIVRAALDSGFEVFASGVTSAGQAEVQAAAGARSHRVRMTALCDPGPVLRRATVTVCHGGSGTVYQSLVHGVPLLCLPDNPDQGLIAGAVRASGAGCVLEPERAGSGGLARILFRFLERDSGPKRCAEHLAGVLAQWDTRARWTRWLHARFGFEPNAAGQARDAAIRKPAEACAG